MGRRKLRMELITEERKRIATFKKRKEGLRKKIEELTTLCGVRACMIIYGPDHQEGPETWPENKDEVREIIGIYEAGNGGKTVGLSDFFHDRRRKIEEELSRLRKKKWEAKVSAWTESSDGLTSGELRILGENITLQSEMVKSRIELMKRSKEEMEMRNMMDSMWFHSPSMAPPPNSTFPPQLPAVEPPQVPLPWHEILDGVYGEGNLTEDCVMAPPPNTILPQVPTTAPPQWPFFWQEDVDDVMFGVTGSNPWGGLICHE